MQHGPLAGKHDHFAERLISLPHVGRFQVADLGFIDRKRHAAGRFLGHQPIELLAGLLGHADALQEQLPVVEADDHVAAVERAAGQALGQGLADARRRAASGVDCRGSGGSSTRAASTSRERSPESCTSLTERTPMSMPIGLKRRAGNQEIMSIGEYVEFGGGSGSSRQDRQGVSGSSGTSGGKSVASVPTSVSPVTGLI